MTADADLDEVRVFWEAHPCGSDTAQSIDRLEYFLGIEQYRYSLLRFIPSVARFESFAGKRVLEIGCGVGTDGTRFARGGASYTGTDLTEAAIALARANFALRGLQGTFMTANAEALPFDDSSYDHVYCFGVIHHTPQPDAIVREIRRVLVPGGTVTVMLYNRSSINHYVEIMGVRKIGRLLLRPAWAPKLLSAAFRLRRDKLEGHRANLLRVPHPTREQWISMNTDGPDCPLARVYSAGEIRALFHEFDGLRTDVHFFDRTHWPGLTRIMSEDLADRIGRRWGWCRLVYAHRPVH